MLNITHYQRNANQNHNEVQLHASQDGCHPKLFLVSWSKPEVTLSTAFTVSHRFRVVVFLFSLIPMHILISFLISSMIWWLFRSVLFSLHMFDFFLFFFPCNWDLVLLHCGQKRWLEWFQIVLNLSKLDLWPGWDLFWRRFCVHLRKRWNWMFGGEIFYRYHLCPAGSLSHLKFVFPC